MSHSELMDHLVTPGHIILQARMMGETSTALITFEELQVPRYIRITALNTSATCIAPTSKLARPVFVWVIILTNALHQLASHAKRAVLRTRHRGTHARQSAAHVEEITPPLTRASLPQATGPEGNSAGTATPICRASARTINVVTG
ncbi:hypothetical protein MRX96_024682 [Rhipicephalus microplus]